ncbi:hypothetical protein QJQ45_027658, partial [Haematococcus lacustris]
QPSPAQPSPAQPSPAQPSPAQPSPAQPSPAQPSPAQPSPAQPSPAQPSPAPLNLANRSKSSKQHHPILAKAAQRLLSAHASTAAARRNWSMWGHTYHNALRNKFSVEAAKREVYLKANLSTRQRPALDSPGPAPPPSPDLVPAAQRLAEGIVPASRVDPVAQPLELRAAVGHAHYPGCSGAASEPGPAAAQPTGGGAAREEAGAGAPAVVVEGAPDAVPSAGGAKKSRKKAAPRVERVVYSESLRKPLPEDHSGPITKVMTWNVAGLRGLLRKNPTAIAQLIAREAPDVLCLQETKISDEHTAGLEAELQLPPGWHAAWSCGSKKGYAGVATLSRLPPLSVRSGLGVEEHDQEGRLLLTEYPALSVVNTYVPNSSAELKRLGYRVDPGGWDDAFSQALRRWDQEKAVVVAGDLNCAHQEIDIHNPKTNLRSAGFTQVQSPTAASLPPQAQPCLLPPTCPRDHFPLTQLPGSELQEERDSFGTRLLGARETGGAGLVDVLRMQHPEVQAYTYYSFRFQCRAKGIGWRLDYTLLSPKLIAQFHDAYILPDVEGSDHVPLGVTLLTDLQAPLPASAPAGEAS